MVALRRMDAVLKSLADPTRRTVYEKIASQGELTVTALLEGAKVSQPAISQHLRALREAGLVSVRWEGRHAYYRAEADGLAPLVDWLTLYGAFWREKFSNLRQLLKKIDP